MTPRQKTDIEIALILREAEQRENAKAVLAALTSRKPWHMWGLVAAIFVSGMIAETFKADPTALLTGMLIGLVAMGTELWSVQRRLDAVIQLLSLGESLRDKPVPEKE